MGGHRGYAPNWYSFCAPYIQALITGEPDQSPTLWAIQQFAAPPVSVVLEIGCLSGKKLVTLVNRGLAKCADGVDIATKALEQGRQLAAERGVADRVSFSEMDLNHPTLPSERYGAIISNGVLHHIENLEACLAALNRSLEPGGVLIASEFIGPTRYCYSAADISLINQGIALLPPELGGNECFDPRELQAKLDADPSESIRSEEVESVVRSIFSDVTAKYYGGTVLMRGLRKAFFQNFDEANPSHQKAYHSILAFEKGALAAGARSHHVYLIARKPES